MSLRFSKRVFLLTALTAFFCLSLALFSSAEDLSQQCLWEKIEQAENTFSKDDYRALLEKCQDYYEQRTDDLAGSIEETAEEKKTLAGKISSLKTKIQNLNYQIAQGNIMIKDLSFQLEDTQESISKTQSKIEDIQEKLITILRLRYEEDRRSTVEVLLAEETLSDFFDNLVALEMLSQKTQELLQDIKALKQDLETQKETMDSEKQDLENLVIIQTLQKNESASNQKEQEYLLKLTESEYQRYLQEKKEAEETVVKIGNLLFELLEVPEGGIKFEDAVSIAKEVSRQTGVRAAFSLAVLWQETRIGQLKGGCYLRDSKTGDGIYIKTNNPAPRTMKPSRDVQPFLSLIQDLNTAGKWQYDAFHTPVSCCMIQNGSYFGWGGAMGPAQFIPSTWALFKERIESLTGSSPASPWNVRDAFLANSLYLKDLGAASQTYEKEIYAALRYFGCTSSWCRSSYGVPVMRAAGCLQDYLDNSEMTVSCRDLIF